MLSFDQVYSSSPDNLQTHPQGIQRPFLKKDFPQTSKVFKAELIKNEPNFWKKRSHFLTTKFAFL
jgi:hypothetical protein